MEIKEELCIWFEENHRHLPFRESNDPYAIWVSEIMAQQTRIETMLPYYEKWMKQYPDIKTLADTPIEEILKSWEGLGYYNRARKLREGAIQVIELYDGKLPQTADELEKINGIGPYTAGAIASIAFNQEAPAIDGNVLRVVSRLLMLEEDIMKQSTKLKVTEIVRKWMSGSNTSHFTQGLMELGALICMPQIVLCDQCPLQLKCKAHQLGKEKLFPIKSKAKKQLEIELCTLFIIDNEQLLMSNDDSDGLMKGFYRLPQVSTIDTSQFDFLGREKHVFSHRIWHMNIYKKKNSDYYLSSNEIWIPFNQLNNISIVSAHRRLIKKYLGQI